MGGRIDSTLKKKEKENAYWTKKQEASTGKAAGKGRKLFGRRDGRRLPLYSGNARKTLRSVKRRLLPISDEARSRRFILFLSSFTKVRGKNVGIALRKIGARFDARLKCRACISLRSHYVENCLKSEAVVVVASLGMAHTQSGDRPMLFLLCKRT